MKDILKLLIIKILRLFLHIFYIIPINKRTILFSSFEGRQYSDNPKYLFLYIKKQYGNKYRYVWVLNDKSTLIQDVKIVRFLSIKHIYYLMTSKFIISNLGIEPFIPKRKNQIFLNTWHGSGAYKSQTLSDKILKNKYSIDLRDYRSKHTDYYVSGCKKYSEEMAISWNAEMEKFIPTGTPRNDILLLEKDKLEIIRKNVLRNLQLSEDYAYILYAPTFRGKSFRNHEVHGIDLNFQQVINCCNKKFNKKFKILFREHLGAQNTIDNDYIIDVSSYPDMQEIMIISDILITDYSSTIWDYSLLCRPGFLYVPDLINYLKERDFYTPIETWSFPYALNNQELCSLIENYDEESANEKIKQHMNNLTSFEVGKASQKIIDILGI